MAQAGSIQSLSGVVTARTSTGQIRELHIGDIVYENELIETGDGAFITISLNDGNLIRLTPNSELLLDESVSNPIDVYDAIVHDVEALQNALLNDEDISELEEETAIGDHTAHDYDFDYHHGDESKGQVGSYLLDVEKDPEKQSVDLPPSNANRFRTDATDNSVNTTVTETQNITTVTLYAEASEVEGGLITYTARVDNAPVTDLTVNLSNGSTITVVAGATSGTVDVAAQGDDVYVDPSTESVSITGTSGGNFESLAINPATVHTTVSDTINTTTLTLSATGSVTEGGTITYTATLTNPTNGDVTVILSNGETITILDGATTGTVDVTTSDDNYSGGNIASVSITSASGGNFENLTVDSTAAVTAISDDSDTTTVSLAATASVIEGGTITYTATLTNPADGDVTVNLSNGQTITISNGATTGTADVTASDDSYGGGNSASVIITSASGGNFENLAVDSTPAFTSISDDIDTTTVTLTQASATVTEGGIATYTISVDHAPATDFDVEVITGHTTTTGGDIVPTIAIVTIAAGTTSTDFTVTNFDDAVTEGNEAYTVQLTGNTSGGGYENVFVDTTSVTTTIIDNEGLPSLSVDDVTVNEAAGTIVFTVTLSNQAAADVTFNFASSDAGATAGHDYTAVSGTGTIAAGTTSTQISIPINNDVYLEGNEDFNITLSNPSANAFIADPVGLGTIADTIDTTTVTLSATGSVAEGGSITYTATVDNAPQGDMTVTLNDGTVITILNGQTTGSATIAAPADDAFIDAGTVTNYIASTSGGNFENLVNANAAGNPVSTTITDTVDVTTVSLSAEAGEFEGGLITYTASIDNTSDTDLTVNLTNGAAITIAAGATTGTVNVAAQSDDVYVDPSTENVTITGTSGGNFESLVINPAVASTSVADTIDDTTVSLTATASVNEGGSITYTASVDNAPQGDMTVTLNDGTVITILNGQTTGSATNAAPADDAFIDAGMVTNFIASTSGGNFENLVNANAAGNPVSTTITDTVDVTTVSISAEAGVFEGGLITYTASIDNASDTDLTVNLSNGAAITIAAGATSGTVDVAAQSDDVYVDPSTENVTITGTSGGNFESLVINPASADTTVADTIDDTTVSLTATASVNEGGSITYTATVDSAPQGDMTVTLNDGTVITILNGQTTGSATIAAPADDAFIDAGTVTNYIASTSGGNLENLVNANAAGNPVSTTITDTVDVTTISLSAEAGEFEGGLITYTASIDNASDTDLIVNLSNGAAITIAAGATTGTVNVAAQSDDVYVDPSTENVTITGTSGGNFESLVINPAVASTSVADTIDDTTVSLTATASVNEGGSITYTASVDNAPQGDMTVTLNDGTVITILNGQTTGSATIAAPADDAFIDAGTVTNYIASTSGGNLENLVNANAAGNPVSTTITDTVDVTTVSVSAEAGEFEGGLITYTATIDNASDTDLTVNLSNGAAITIAAGATSGTVDVAAQSDDVYVDPSTENVTITGTSGGNLESLVLNPALASTAVTDTIDTTTVTLTQASAAVAEGATATYTVSVDHAPATDFDVEVITGHTTTADGDLVPTTLTVTITAGTTSTDFTLTNIDDAITEGNEAYTVQLTGNTSGGGYEDVLVDTTTVTTTIIDNEGLPSLSIDDVTVNESAGTIVFTVTLSNPAAADVTFDFASTDAGATAGQDYTAVSGTGTIAAGNTSTQITIPISDDVYLEGNEVFNVTLSNQSANALIADPVGVGTIADTIDTTTVTLSATGSVVEGGIITYTAALTNPADGDVTVSLSNGQTITIADGNSTGTVNVTASDDVYGGGDSASVTINSASGGNFESLAVNTTPAVTTISDDSDTTTVSLTATGTVVEGGTITYTASLTNPADGDVTVSLSNGQTLTIADGNSTSTVNVTASDDVYGGGDSASVTIDSASGGNFENLAVNTTPAVTTITDDSDTTTVSLTATGTVIEGGTITYTASLTNPADGDVTVSLSNGQTITIADGNSTGTVNVTASDDVYGGGDSASVTINSATGGNFEDLTLDATPAVTTITDDSDTTTVTLSATGSVVEGGIITYTASLTNPADGDVTVSLSNGQTITIADGNSTGTVNVIASDDVYGGGDSASVTINSATGGNFENLAVDATPAVTTITDDSDTTTVSLTATGSVVEGGTITYTATLTNPADGDVTVDLSNGQTITILDSNSTGAVDVTASDDVYGGGDSASVTIASATGGNFEDLAVDATPAVTTITDDSDTTTVSLAATGSVVEGGTITYTATLTNPADGDVTVNLSNGQTITISDGNSTGTIDFTASDDVYGGGDSASVTIASATGGNFENLAVDATPAVTTITDDSDTTTVSLAATGSVVEGGSITYTASVDNAPQGDMTVTLNDGTVITILNGQTTGSATVAAPADDAFIDAGTVTNYIASTSGGNFENLVNANASGNPVSTTITDTVDVTTVSLTAEANEVEGGLITYSANIDNASDTDLTINLSNGAAIVIAAGATSGTVDVAAQSDDDYVDPSTENVSITGTSGGNFESLVINPAIASTSVADTIDDTTVTLTATGSVAEGGSITYTASVDNAPQGDMTVTLNDGTVITILNGQTTGSATIAAPADDAFIDAGTVTNFIASTSGGNFENLVNANAAGNPVSTTITDTLDVTTVSLSAEAGEFEGGLITYTANIDNASDTDLTVNLSNGATITVAAGATSGTVDVAAQSDDVYVDPSTENVTITGTSGGNFESLVINPATASTSVADTIDDTTVSLNATASVAEGGSITYTASVDNATQGDMTVTLNDGTVITILNGQTTGSATIAAPADDAFIDAGTVTNYIASTSGGNFENLVNANASGNPVSTTITDTVDVTTVSLTAEANEVEGGMITYTADIDNASDTDLTVNLSNGAAITIDAGAISGTVDVAAQSDDVYVDPSTESVTITGTTGGNFESLVIDPTTADTFVADNHDDTIISLTATNSVTEGGSITYTATVDNAPQGDMTVTLNDGTVITILNGQTTGSATIAAPADDAFIDAGTVTNHIASTSGGNFENLVNANAAGNPVSTSITDTVDVTTVSVSAEAGEVEGGMITYTASIENASDTDLTVNLSNGAAITIAAGATSGTVDVAAQSDDVYVDPSTENVTITGTSGGNFESLVIDPAVASTSVADTIDTTTVTLSATASVAEGGSITYSATVDNAPQGSDLVIDLDNAAQITIAAGTTSGNVVVAAPADDAYLDAVNLTVGIVGTNGGGNFENLDITDTATTAITDTIDTSTVSITGPGSVTEGDTTSDYTVTLSNPAASDVTVNLTYSGTASDGSDFTGVANVVITTGNTSQDFTIDTLEDPLLEGAESITVSIDSLSGGGFENLIAHPVNNSVTTSIVDNDFAPTTDDVNAAGLEDAASISVVLSGSDADGTVASFNLSSLPTNGTLYTDAGLTTLAVTGTDYPAAAETLTLYFVPDSEWSGATSFDYTATDNTGLTDATPATATISVSAVNDYAALDLDANDSSGAAGADFQTTFTEGGGGVSIADSDIAITDIDDTHIESATITITNVETDDLLIVGSLPAGVTAGAYDSATGSITLTGSATLAEYQQAIRAIQFDNVGNSSGTPRNIEVTVNDGQNDSNAAVSTININMLPTVSIDDISVQEPSSGTAVMTFTVSIDQAIGSDLTFDYRTADVSAIAGSDYVGIGPTTGTITAGSTSTTITVTINSDANVFEGDETFTLDLSNFNHTVNFQSGAHLISGGIQGIGNIGVNNGPPDAVDDAFITAPDTPLVTGNVLTNDILVDNAVYSSHDGTSSQGGTVTYNGDGTFTYNPASGFTGIDTFTYTIIDDDGQLDTATVSVDVTSAILNPPSVAGVPDINYTENDAPTNILTGISLTDVDSSTLSSVVVRINGYLGSQDVLDYLTAGTSVNAAVSISGTTWELTLTNGADISEYLSVLNSLTYENTSENPSASTRAVTVEAYDESYNNLFSSDSGDLSILPVNDAPTVYDNSSFVVADSMNNGLGVTMPTDPDTDDNTLVITVTGLPGAIGTVTLADGTPVNIGDTLTRTELAALEFDAGSTDGVGQFTYTVFDGQQTTAGTTTINVGSTDPDAATVYESALPDGTGTDGGSATVSGNLFDNDAAAGNSIDSVDFGATNYTPTAGVVTINTAIGTLTVYADNSTPGFQAGDYVYALNASDGSGGNVVENFTYNFTNVVPFSETLSINIEDDEPIAHNLVESVPESEEQIFNLVLTLDVSTSMNAVVGSTTRLELAKEALVSLSDAYFKQSSQVQVSVLLFANGAHELGTYSSFESVQSAINAVTDVNTTTYSNDLGSGNLTNSTSYVDATAMIQNVLATDLATQNPADGIRNISYFLSDGAVTADGTPVGNGFDNFVNTNSIYSYSVGIGTGLPDDLTDLNFIHNIDSMGKGYDTVDPALIVEDVSQLQSELLSTVPTAFGGNITIDINGNIDNVLFGADGGYVESISLDLGGTYYTFTYDGNTISIPPALAATVIVDGSTLTLDADDGFTYGTLNFNFADGSYTFSAPNGKAPDSVEFDFSIVDGDGDTASATATINIVDDSPEARDDLHSISAFETAEGNVITAIGTDGGPTFGLDYTPFATQGGGVDKIVDDAAITEFTYKGSTITLDLTLTTNTIPAPPPAGGSENVAINSGTNFATTNVSLSANAGFNANGAGITGGRSSATLDNADGGEALTVSFDSVALPYGINNLILTMDDFQNNYNDAVTITIYDASGTILDTIVQAATTAGAENVDLSAYTGIGSVDIVYTGSGRDAQLSNVAFDPHAPATIDVTSLDQTGGTNGSNLSWVYSYDYDLNGDPVFDATITDLNDGSTFSMRSNGYYNYSPAVTGDSVDLTSQANVDASDLGVSIRTGGTTLEYNTNGVGIAGGNGTLLSSGEAILITFDAIALPNGVEDLYLTFNDFQSNNTDQATVIVTHDTDGDGTLTTDTVVFSATNNNSTEILDLTQYTGITQLDIEYTGGGWDLGVGNVTYVPTTSGGGGNDPIVVDYMLTDKDGQSDTAQLAIYEIENEITGTVGADSIAGGALNDAISGDAGNDILSGGDGHDSLSGGAGADTLAGDAGDDYISGGDDADSIHGGSGKDHINGDAGDDILDGGTGDDIVLGGTGDDLVFGGAGDDLLEGETGDDALSGGSGDDTLVGGEGNDILDGGDGSDELLGGKGADTIVFDENDSTIDGGAGNDTLLISNDVLDFSAIQSGTIDDIEKLDLNAGEAQSVSLNLDNVLDMTGADNILEVTGGEGDQITFDIHGTNGDWTYEGGGLFTNANGIDQVQILPVNDPDNKVQIFTDDGTPIE